MESYHKPLGLNAIQHNAARKIARRLDDEVADAFYNIKKKATPWVIYNYLGGRRLITSIRRSITNLTVDGLLKKHTEIIKERHGSNNHLWKINEEKYKQVYGK